MELLKEITDLISTFNCESAIEHDDYRIKITLLLEKEPDRKLLMISVLSEPDPNGNDAAVSYFANKELVFSLFGVFTDIIPGLIENGFIVLKPKLDETLN